MEQTITIIFENGGEADITFGVAEDNPIARVEFTEPYDTDIDEITFELEPDRTLN